MSISASHEAVEMQNREMRNGQNPGASAHAKSNAHEFPNATGGVNRLGSFVRHGNSGGKPKPRGKIVSEDRHVIRTLQTDTLTI